MVSIFRRTLISHLLPLMILFASANTLNFVLYKLFLYDNNAIADFRDDEGNNAWHYFFFRNPMFNPSRKSEYDVREYDCYEFLTENGASPDTPNNMGFSYNQINQAMKKYLGVKK